MKFPGQQSPNHFSFYEALPHQLRCRRSICNTCSKDLYTILPFVLKHVLPPLPCSLWKLQNGPSLGIPRSIVNPYSLCQVNPFFPKLACSFQSPYITHPFFILPLKRHNSSHHHASLLALIIVLEVHRRQQRWPNCHQQLTEAPKLCMVLFVRLLLPLTRILSLVFSSHSAQPLNLFKLNCNFSEGRGCNAWVPPRSVTPPVIDSPWSLLWSDLGPDALPDAVPFSRLLEHAGILCWCRSRDACSKGNLWERCNWYCFANWCHKWF